MAKYVQMVRGMLSDGKMVFNAQMVTMGAIAIKMIAQMMSMINFVISSSRFRP